MGEIVETTLDGRPGLSVTLPGIGGSDVHVTAAGLSGINVVTSNPARLIVADVDGDDRLRPDLGRTPADLAAWLPTAEDFVASIHFEARSQP